jgi:hypothetical protein
VRGVKKCFLGLLQTALLSAEGKNANCKKGPVKYEEINACNIS